MTLDSHEVNYLVLRYLKDSGFTHSAYTFQSESLVPLDTFDTIAPQPQPGYLVRVLQKGLQYMAIEAHIMRDGTEKDCAAPFKLFGEHKCSTTKIRQQQQHQHQQLDPSIVAAADAAAPLTAESLMEIDSTAYPSANDVNGGANNSNDGLATPAATAPPAAAAAAVATVPMTQSVSRGKTEKTRQQKVKSRSSTPAVPPATVSVPAQSASNDMDIDEPKHGQKQPLNNMSQMAASLPANNNDSGSDEPMLIDSTVTASRKQRSGGSGRQASGVISPTAGISPSSFVTNVTEGCVTLAGHTSEAFVASWNPNTSSQLATGAGDATVRLWNVPASLALNDKVNGWAAAANAANSQSGDPLTIVLQHHPARDGVNRDITSIDWSPEGNLLATASYDGLVRVWTANGSLRWLLRQHETPVLTVRWNKTSTLLASGDTAGNIVLWDESTGDATQVLKIHDESVMDLDWRDDVKYATCSKDKTVRVFQAGQSSPLRILRGHTADVNTVRWDACGDLLASCSDDCTVRIWSLSSDTPSYVMRGHTAGVYTIAWNPRRMTGRPRIIASASLDSDVRLWNAETGDCLRTFTLHTSTVYTVAFSPDGRWLASGGQDNHVFVWAAKDCSVLRKFVLDGAAYDITWTSANRFAVALASGKVAVIDAKS
ncbi:WD40 repeat-like protein [Ramicandelaber brevisporus]|nr:WD40 repeat-like protein [Ramicandelaber brevisporus]